MKYIIIYVRFHANEKTMKYIKYSKDICIVVYEVSLCFIVIYLLLLIFSGVFLKIFMLYIVIVTFNTLLPLKKNKILSNIKMAAQLI